MAHIAIASSDLPENIPRSVYPRPHTRTQFSTGLFARYKAPKNIKRLFFVVRLDVGTRYPPPRLLIASIVYACMNDCTIGVLYAYGARSPMES